MIKLAVA